MIGWRNRDFSLTNSQKLWSLSNFHRTASPPFDPNRVLPDVVVVGGGAMGDFMSSAPPFSSLGLCFPYRRWLIGFDGEAQSWLLWYWRLQISRLILLLATSASFVSYGSLRFAVVPMDVVLPVAGLLFRSNLSILLVVVAESLRGICVFCLYGITVCVSVLVVSMWVSCSGWVVGGVCGWLPFVAVVVLFVVWAFVSMVCVFLALVQQRMGWLQIWTLFVVVEFQKPVRVRFD